MRNPLPPPGEPVVVRHVVTTRTVPWGSPDHRRARYRRLPITTLVAFMFVVWFLLLVGIAWLVTHDWR